MKRKNKCVLRGLKCVLFTAVILFETLALHAGFAAAAADSPMVTGPVTGGNGVPILWATAFDLADIGYQQAEFFISGTANAYEPVSGTEFDVDGKWTVESSATAEYTTRAIVYRPIDPKRFNGTVIVEWFNVSSGLDTAPDWTSTHNELARKGYIWVGISAQEIGLNSTKYQDWDRYGTHLSHPGDSFSYDIFAQAGQAIWENPDILFGDGLVPEVVIATGESQSAFRLVTYIDAVHPLVAVYDGFLVHSRFAVGAPLSDTVDVPGPTQIRDDLNVPVLVFMTETDVAISAFTVRQPDTGKYRLWEVAGTAHADYYTLVIGTYDIGDGQGTVDALGAMQGDPPPDVVVPGILECYGINTGPQYWVLQAALDALNRWVTTGTPPPVAPRFVVEPEGFALDQHNNVLGGVRTPHVDVPIAVLSGLPTSMDGFCSLFGSTTPFTAEKIAELYPNHGRFMLQWARATHMAVWGGFILPKDGKELIKAAAKSKIGKRCRSKR